MMTDVPIVCSFMPRAQNVHKGLSVENGIQTACRFSQFAGPRPSCFAILVFLLP